MNQNTENITSFSKSVIRLHHIQNILHNFAPDKTKTADKNS